MNLSLIDCLDAAARTGRGITILAEGGPLKISYADLARTAARVAGGLQGVQNHGLPVILVYPTGPEFVETFWGAMWAGLIPAPLPLPRPFADLEEYARRVAYCSARASGAPVVTTPAIAALLRETTAGRDLRVLDVAELRAKAPVDARPQPTALLQFTSGSLSDPKGTMLSHRAVIADVHGLTERLAVDTRDVAAGWVPLVHDMGLVGGQLWPVVSGLDTVLIPTERFVSDPSLWLRAMHEFRATMTFSPPFGFGLAARRAEPARYDLRSLRHAIVGAEPIDARTLRTFTKTFAPSGLRETVVRPCYGMAEVVVDATAAAPDAPLVTLHVAPGLQPGKTVRLVGHGEGPELVACGTALSCLEVVVADGAGQPVPERTIGEIRVRGAARFDGYWGDPEATARALDGAWLKTGDLGFYSGGDLYVAGRQKDVIIQRGTHLFPEEIEAVAYDVPDVRPRGALAFGEMDPSGGRERITLVLETSEPEERRAAIADGAIRAIADRLDCNIDRVVFCGPRELPRTPSGKIRRGEGRERWGQSAPDAPTAQKEHR